MTLHARTLEVSYKILSTRININPISIPVESPIVNTQSAAISLASLQPPLMTAPPLQPRPATTGSLDLMLPLQPKLLPGYNLQSSFLSTTLSTVRPPDFLDRGDLKDEFKPSIDIIVEKGESIDSVEEDSCNNKIFVDSLVNNESDNYNNIIDEINDNEINDNECNEINSNVITDTVVSSDDSPNNNSY